MTTLHRTFSTWTARIAGTVLVTILLLAVFGGAIAPDDPLGQNPNDTFVHAGNAAHLLGTDYVGRDVLSRILAGAGASVLLALAMVGVGLMLGALPGVLSVFAGRATEFALQRFTDALMTLPPIVFAIAVAGLFANGQLGAIVAIGVLLAPLFFRVARAETLGYAHTQYVEAAQLLGASRWWIVRRHIARKVVPTIAVTTATATGYAVLAAASLGFLGLGVQAPNPTWGGMLAANVQHLADDAWAPIWPGLFIALTAWSLNALADALRDGLSVGSQVLSPAAQAEASFGFTEPELVLEEPAASTAGTPTGAEAAALDGAEGPGDPDPLTKRAAPARVEVGHAR
ncbi:MAG: ABC transporter permease [Solirubrobacteraceae bacterium]|nr:ABC transporter permease [Solirubrobacteraceae bacterium]